MSKGTKKGPSTAAKAVAFVIAASCLVVFITAVVPAVRFAQRVQQAESRSTDPALQGTVDCVKACSLRMAPQEGDSHRVSHKAVPLTPDYGEAAKVTESRTADGAFVKTVLFTNMLIDRIYPSMRGPNKEEHVNLTKSDGAVWITRYRAEVLDPATGSGLQEYMCHTNLDLAGVPKSEANGYMRQEFCISQGQKEIVMPKGYALRIPDDNNLQWRLWVMVLNNNDHVVKKVLNFQSRIEYYDAVTAAKKKLIPLYQTGAALFPLTVDSNARPGEPTVKTAVEAEVSDRMDGRRRTGHWMVPPGRQELAEDVTRQMNIKRDTTIHYIWMHIHPYAESVEIWDKTANKSLWKGTCQNDPNPKRAAILSTDHYSSTTGLKVYKDHQYELRSVYNNVTDHDVDAMVSVWMYARSYEKD